MPPMMVPGIVICLQLASPLLYCPVKVNSEGIEDEAFFLQLVFWMIYVD